MPFDVDSLVRAVLSSSPHPLIGELTRSFNLLFGEPRFIRALRINGADDGRGPLLIPTTADKLAVVIAELEGTSRTVEFFASLNAVRETPHLPKDAWHTCVTPAVETRRWLLFDFDPVREHGLNSTDGELAGAIRAAAVMIEGQRRLGWPDPVVALSGNGIHLLYATILPLTRIVDEVVKQTLARASALYSTDQVIVDRNVWDIQRLVRLYGTMNRKGPHIHDRPQRRSRILDSPAAPAPITFEQLRSFVNEAESVPRSVMTSESIRQKRHLTGEDVVQLLDGAKPAGDGSSLWIARCPAHTDGSPSLSVRETLDGTILLHCFAGCSNDQVIEKLGLEYRQLFASGSRTRPRQERKAHQPHPVNEDLASYAWHCHQSATENVIRPLADQLKLPAWSLRQIGTGWDPGRGAWTFPECRFDGGVIGVQLRFPKGEKRCVAGSHRGLILPAGWQNYRGEVWLPEGASDVAALLSIGRQAIGRPSACHCADLPIVARNLGFTPVVCGENDRGADGSWPGRNGAQLCAEQIVLATGKPVEVLYPPSGDKDIRAYITRTI